MVFLESGKRGFSGQVLNEYATDGSTFDERKNIDHETLKRTVLIF